MFQEPQQKGLFTFYRQQADIEAHLRFKSPRIEKTQSKNKQSKDITLPQNTQHKNIKLQRYETSKEPITEQKNYSPKYKQVQILPQKYIQNQEDCISQQNQEIISKSPLSIPSKQIQRSFILDNYQRLFDLQSKSLSLPKISKPKGLSQIELKNQSNSMVLMRKGNYLQRKRGELTCLKSHKDNSAQMQSSRQQTSLDKAFPLIHIQSNTSVNYLIPKVKMKSKIIDKVFRLKNQKQIKKIRKQLQTQRLMEKQFFNQNFNSSPRQEINSLRSSSLFPKLLSSEQHQVRNDFAILFAQQNQTYDFVHARKSQNVRKSLNKQDSAQKMNELSNKRYQQLLILLKRCKYHLN